MKTLFSIIIALTAIVPMQAKTLIAYYSYTQNTHTIVTELASMIEADVLRIEPAEKGLDYAANNYAIGTAQLTAINNNPDDLSSYPAIDPVNVDMSLYDMVIIATPLWWSQMAAPFQTFLFMYGNEMAGKNIGVIVSSASSGISGVVADAKRLIPQGKFIEPNLWIRSSQTSSCSPLIRQWLLDIDYETLVSGIDNTTSTVLPSLKVTSFGHDIIVEGVDNNSQVTIYSANGRMVQSGKGNRHHIPGNGLFIIASENKAIRVVI